MGSRSACTRAAHAPRPSFIGIVSAILGLAVCVGATPASAIVVNVAGHAYGVTPIQGVSPTSLPGAYKAPSSRSGRSGVHPYDSGGPMISNGGPVMHEVTTHLIYWDPGQEFTATTKGIIKKFFTDVAVDSGLASNVFGVAGQYTDATGNAAYSSTFAGESSDTEPYPASGCTIPPGGDSGVYNKCLTDKQVKEQLSSYVAKNKLETGLAQQYFVLFPHKTVTCFPEEGGKHPCSNNSFCAYHSVIKPGTSEEIIYSDIPTSLLYKSGVKGCQADGWTAVQEPNGDSTGYADVALKYISHEYIEASTDPRLNNWFDASGREIGDKCNLWAPTAEEESDPNAFEPTLGGEQAKGTLFNQSINAHHYYIQSEWDNGAKACSMRPVPLAGVGFTPSPATTIVGSPVSFAGTAVDVYSGLRFTWTFGDGGVGEGSVPSHTYAAAGSYEVTMTAKDGLTGATAAAVRHTIVVNDQPTASFTLSPNPATAGTAVSFNGSASADPDGAIVTYGWQFGDGASGAGVGPSHAYAGAGTYLVTLTVTDSAGASASATHAVSVGAAPAPAGASSIGGGSEAPSGSSTPGNLSSVGTSVDPKTGAITLTASVQEAGTFSWLLTFQNGTFGVFAAKNPKCKSGFARLRGKCRPTRLVFARGSRAAVGPGAVTFTIRPTTSAWKALRNALKRRMGVPVVATLTFQSMHGPGPVTHTSRLTVKLKTR